MGLFDDKKILQITPKVLKISQKLTRLCYNKIMNQTAHRVLTICLVGLLFYLLAWPFLNSLISGNYFIKAGDEGGQTMSYAVRINGDHTIQASIEYYNNIATEEQGKNNTGPFNANITTETYDKIRAIIGEYAGLHLFARNHIGFAFYYSGNETFSSFYTAQEKSRLLALAETLTWIARGSEKTDTKRSSATYEEKGYERLNEIYTSLNL